MRFSTAAAILSALASSGCASLPLACIPPARPMVSAEILFGRNIGTTLGVSEAAFARFVAEEVTPRFPDGLTIVDARGQYRDAERSRLIREPSKIVLITFTDEPQKRAALDAVAEAYKARFRQRSVLTTVRSVCATF